MRIKFSHIAPLLATGAAAIAIAAAPTAMAANADPAPVFPNRHTTLAGELPGNNQINDSTGPTVYSPQYPYAEGDYYGGYGGYGHGFGGGFAGGHGGGHGR
jgi:hypothetical protein